MDPRKKRLEPGCIEGECVRVREEVPERQVFLDTVPCSRRDDPDPESGVNQVTMPGVAGGDWHVFLGQHLLEDVLDSKVEGMQQRRRAGDLKPRYAHSD